jgi:hypothetical protein
MHWGFWKGRMEIDLKKRSFKPGDTVEGTVSFELKNPTKARSFTVQLKGEELIHTRKHGGDGQSSSNTETVTICDIKEKIDGEREYHKEKLPFKIRIPSNVMREGRETAVTQAIEGVAEILTGRSERSEFKWYVKANLDIPKAVDVSKTEKISVYE